MEEMPEFMESLRLEPIDMYEGLTGIFNGLSFHRVTSSSKESSTIDVYDFEQSNLFKFNSKHAESILDLPEGLYRFNRSNSLFRIDEENSGDYGKIISILADKSSPIYEYVKYKDSLEIVNLSKAEKEADKDFTEDLGNEVIEMNSVLRFLPYKGRTVYAVLNNNDINKRYDVYSEDYRVAELICNEYNQYTWQYGNARGELQGSIKKAIKDLIDQKLADERYKHSMDMAIEIVNNYEEKYGIRAKTNNTHEF